MPGATDPVAGLEDTEVVVAGLVELDRGADPREAPADDNDFVVGGSDIRNIHVPKVPTRSAQQLNGRVFAELGLASLEPANLAVTSQVPDFGSAMEAAYLLEALSVAAVLISGLNFEPDWRSSVTVTPWPRSFGFTEPLVFTLPPVVLTLSVVFDFSL